MSSRVKWIIVIATLFLYTVLIWVLVPLVGPTINVLCMLAPIVATLMFGFRVGLAVLLANWGLSYVIMANIKTLQPADDITRAIPPFIASVFFTFGAGRIRNYMLQRKDAEEALRESEHRYRLIFEHSADGILLLDESGIILDASPKVTEHVGFEPSELVGRPLVETHIFDEKAAMSFTYLITEVHRSSSEYELIGCNKHGERIHLQLTFSSFDTSSSDAHWICLMKNVTEKKEMHEMLLESKKMEAIGRLAGGVAHDLNNILNAIVGSAHAHKHEHEHCEVGFEDIDNITAACNRGAQLTGSLLGFTRKSNVTKEMFSLNQVLQSVLAVTERTSLKEVHYESRLEPNLPEIEGDRHQIETALMNICLNAHDAMEQGGTLTVTSYSDADGIWTLISDTGSGMDDDVRERAFEPFFTTKPVGKGTGLGLAMAYGVMQSHNGKIQLQSTPGEGTTVTLWFPRAKGNLKLRKIEGEPETGSDEQILVGHTVLLVDDEPLVLRAGMRMLSTLGCRVISAASGEKAVELFASNDEISLVLLDLIMPGMDGTETMRRIRERNETIPVILVSGYTQNIERVSAMRQANECEFLPKPYSPAALIATVRKVLS